MGVRFRIVNIGIVAREHCASLILSEIDGYKKRGANASLLLSQHNKKNIEKTIDIYFLSGIIKVSKDTENGIKQGENGMIGYSKVDRFWEVEAECTFWRVVEQNGLEDATENAIEIGMLDIDQFLFDMWDNGEYKPTDIEILNEVKNIVR